jgi:hypothetical protein
MTAAIVEDTPPRKGDEIRARIEANRRKRLEIAEAMKREAGVTDHEINYRDLGGLAYTGTGQIMSPEGRKIMELYTLAHECGHIFLHSIGTPGNRLPDHVKELEASLYAHQALAEYGMATPRVWTDWSRVYVGQWITKDRAAGIRIDPQAQAYANGSLPTFAPLRTVPATWRKFKAAVPRSSPRSTQPAWNRLRPASRRTIGPHRPARIYTAKDFDPDGRLTRFQTELRDLPEFIWQWFCAGFTLAMLASMLGAGSMVSENLDAAGWTLSTDWRHATVGAVGGLVIASLAMVGRTLRR